MESLQLDRDLAVRLRQRVYEATQTRKAERSADVNDSTMAAWANELSAVADFSVLAAAAVAGYDGAQATPIRTGGATDDGGRDARSRSPSASPSNFI